MTNKISKTTKKAFTLAEVMITMAVVGIVAAMTIPTLMNNYQRQTYATSLHKVYNEVTQAVQQAMTDKNADTVTEAGLTSTSALNNWVRNYFDVAMDCSGDSTKCLAPNAEYTKMNKDTNFMDSRTGQNYFGLASGAVIRPLYSKEGSKVFNIFIDTNGKKGPNILGRDSFFIGIYENGLVDDFKNNSTSAPLPTSDREDLFNNQCNSSESTGLWGCFGKLLNDGWQMTY